VMRSLLILKGLTYQPTGGIIAAATASLPEQIGGPRNWDYRFCWLRDATFTLYALLDAGYTEEADAWRRWLLRAIGGSPAQMQVLYGPACERMLFEHHLDHLSGYENSRPVRIGNAASGQFQLDVYGEVLDAMHQARRRHLEGNSEAWRLQRHLIDFVIGHWEDKDHGIWEVRGPSRHFTHSKVMAWVAIDRAVQACEKFGLLGDVSVWREVRDRIHREICARGYHEKRGTFVQSFDGEDLDASLLMIPLVGFLPPDDPRVRSTISAIEHELVQDGLVLRYRDMSKIDKMPHSEGAFLPCSFWLADCMNITGRPDEARELFEHLLSLRNDLGLLSEEYDTVTGRLVGNFPQAFSHVALINTACNLAKEHGPASERGRRHRH
ncbi:MAG TPA: glycoside hydrolase family 15 protein, partial [Chthoniobacterales bacterium]